MRYWQPKTFKTKPRVGVAVAAYLADKPDVNKLVILCHAFITQTYDNWRLHIVHDGPWLHGLPTLPDDPRITLEHTPERKASFGHPHRQAALERLAADCEWLGMTNQDNYYVPVYLEWMLSQALSNSASLVYCDAVHSHRSWRLLPGALVRGQIDLGNFLFHRDLTRKIKFDKFTFAGDWDYLSRLKKVSKRQARVPAALFVHN